MKKFNIFMISVSLSLCSVLTAGTVSPKLCTVISAGEITAEEENISVPVSPVISKGGAEFSYNTSYSAVIIDGEGTFTSGELNDFMSSCQKTNYIVIGKNITIPENSSVYNPFLLTFTCTFYNTEPPCPIFCYSESDTYAKYTAMINALCQEKETVEARLPFKINLIPDTTDTKDVIYVPADVEIPPVQTENRIQLLGRNHNNISFYYKEADHGLIIDGSGSFSVDDYIEYCGSVIDHVNYIVVGKNVEIPESSEQESNINIFILSVMGVSRSKLYTYADTDCVKKVNSMVEHMKKPELYNLNIIDENTNVCDIYETCNETLFTRGDINGDTTVDLTDLSELSLLLIGDNTSDSVTEKIADIDDDNKITLADLTRLKQYISKSLKTWDGTKIYQSYKLY